MLPAIQWLPLQGVQVSQRIDHVVINVGQQLDQAAEQFVRLGFQLTPRGHHSLGSSNHLAIFGDDYLELIGVEAARAHLPGARWEHPDGLVGLVFKTDQADKTWADLSARGVPLEGTGTQDFHRPVAAVDGEIRDARFRTVRIASQAIPNGRVFFCQHETPDLVWQAPMQRHPNGVTGVAEYVYLCHDPVADAAILTQAFGESSITPAEGGLCLVAADARVLFLDAREIEARFGQDVAAFSSQGDRAVALTLRVTELDQVRRVLRESGIEAREHHGRLIVAPAQACGVILAFTTA